MAKERVEIEIDVDSRDATRDLKRVEQGMSRVSRATDKATQSTRGISQATKNSGRQFGMVINEVTELGMGFSALSPATRMLGTQFAGAGNAAVMMGGAMGPIGAAAGLLIGSLPILIGWLTDTGDTFGDTADEVDNATKSLDDFISASNRAVAARARAERLAMGVGGVEETRGALGQARSRQGALQRQISGVLREIGVSTGSRAGNEILQAAVQGDVDRLRRALDQAAPGRASAILENRDQLVGLTRQYAQSREEVSRLERDVAMAIRDQNEGMIEEVEFQRIAAEQEEGRARSSRKTADNIRDQADQLERLMQAAMQGNQMRGLAGQVLSGIGGGDALASAQAAGDEASRSLQKTAEGENAQLQADQANRAQREQQRIEALNRSWEHRLRLFRQTREEAQELAAHTGTVQDEFGGLISDLAQGADFASALQERFKAVLIGIGEENIASGVTKLFEGAALTILGGAGAPLIGVGAAQIAFGAALAGGGAAIPSASVPSGGGGSARPSGGGARPTGGGNQTVIVNYNSPVPESQIGRQQKRAEREASRRFGSTRGSVAA